MRFVSNSCVSRKYKSLRKPLLFVFQTGSQTLKIDSSGSGDGNKFPLPYDVPITPYEDKDKPWFSDIYRE